VAQVKWRLFGDFDDLQPPVPHQYWQRDIIKMTDNACFVDAGAFDGDTLAQFVDFTAGRFRSAYLFEPDAANLAAIKERLRSFSETLRSRVHVLPFAVADSNYKLPFSGGMGASSTVGIGDDNVECVALDRVLQEVPDYVKYDVEGFELRALAGTRKIIEDHAPILAVCAYHIQNHLWEVPLLIHSLNSA
jgi:FkbM family methyltransferase